MGRGYSFHVAACVVFTASAILHELAVGVPTHNIIGESRRAMPNRLRRTSHLS